MFTLTLEGFRPRRTRPFPALPAEHARHSPSSFTNRQTFQHSNLLTLREPISFRIHTSAKRACNSRRIRTSKTQDLKRFRMNTYGKTRGEGPATEGTPTDRLLPKSSSATLLSRSTQTGDPVAPFTENFCFSKEACRANPGAHHGRRRHHDGWLRHALVPTRRHGPRNQKLRCSRRPRPDSRPHRQTPYR